MKNLLLDLLRPPVRAARSIRDRSLHPIRRRRAEKLVRGLDGPTSILFMCTGNICRSPYAEKVFPEMLARAGVNGEVRVTSAGFLRSGRPSPEAAVRLAGERRVALDEHRSRQIEPMDIAGSALIVAMEVQHQRKILRMDGGRSVPVLLLGDLDPEMPLRREIKDPWSEADAVFNSSFDRIERCLEVLGGLIAEDRKG